MKNTILCGKDIRKTFTQSGKETQILLGIDVNIYEGDFTLFPAFRYDCCSRRTGWYALGSSNDRSDCIFCDEVGRYQ